MVPTGLFIQALNEMIDNQGKRLSALRNYIPDVVLLSLFGIAAVACGFAGYASGFDRFRTRLPVFITAFVVCVGRRKGETDVIIGKAPGRDRRTRSTGRSLRRGGPDGSFAR